MRRTSPVAAALMRHRPEPGDAWTCSCGKVETSEVNLYEHMADMCEEAAMAEAVRDVLDVADDELGDLLAGVRRDLRNALKARLT